MSICKINPGLARAVAVSQDMLSAAEKGDLQCLRPLDLERMELLKCFRSGAKLISTADQALLQQITELNDRTIGLVEHQRRGKGRDLDMAAVGRRAVAAYSENRPRR